MENYQRLCLAEREEIYRLLKSGSSKSAIAKLIGRSDRAILNELKRCADDTLGYLPDRAQAHADAMASKRRGSPDFLKQAQLEHLHERLKFGCSPEQIAGRLKLENSPLYLCHESIYRIIFSPQGCAIGLPKLLPRKQKKRKSRTGRKPCSGGIVGATSIHERPESINNRKVFGHWEGDGVMFRRVYQPNVTTLVERVSRFACLRYNRNHTTGIVVPEIVQGLQKLPPHARMSITFDRGTEFASHQLICDTLCMQTYFCDPHSPWQKGGNENFNGRLRRYLPKGKIPPNLCQEKLDQIVEKMNNTPRKCLGYKTPAEVFQQLAFPTKLKKLR